MNEEKNIDPLVSMQQELCDMWGINNQSKYVFYYDESNNCRKFWVDNSKQQFNTDYEADFVLAGLVRKEEKSLYTLLYMEKEKFRELVEKSNRNNGVMNTRINLIYLGNVTPETDLLLYQNCIRRIHDIAAVKAAYGEQGYHPPEYITKETVAVIHSFIEKRYGENISKEMRDIQAVAMKKFIVGSVERYRKDRPLRHKILHPKEVRRNYFFKNHVSGVNDAITEDFFEYLKERMKECPSFVYYKEIRPFQSMEVSGSEQKRYRIAYPAAYEELYDGWKLDFVAQTYGWDKSFIVPIEALDRSGEFRWWRLMQQMQRIGQLYVSQTMWTVQ